MAGRSKDLQRILAKLDRLGKEPVARIRAAIDKGAEEVTAAQRALVPVDDGDLRNSIRTEPGDHPLQVVITAGGEATTREVRQGSGIEYDYALAQEFGTREMAPNSFFFAPWRLLRRRVVGRVDRVGRRAFREIWRRSK